MRSFLKSKKFKIIICIIAFCIGIMIYGYTHKEYSSGFETAVNTVFNPLRRLTTKVETSVSKKLDRFNDSDSAYDENIKLKKEISKYKQMQADYDSTKDELAELKKFMGIKEENKDFVLSDPCQVIGYVTNDPYKSFYIDKGKKDKIEYYSPVVTSEGLVGIVTEVAESYSVVTTIMSDDISISAAVSSTGQTGIISGSMEAFGDGCTRMNHIEKTKDGIKKGDIIVTAAGSGIFPKGYLIGTVKDINDSESGLTSFASIEPAVNFDNLSTVMCILDFDGKGKITKTPQRTTTTTETSTILSTDESGNTIYTQTSTTTTTTVKVG